MDINNLLLDILDICIKIYSIFSRKPYATVKLQFAPQKDRSGTVTRESMALTIINESVPVIDVQKVWFLTSFNRIVESAFLNAKMPVKVLKRDRATFFFPIDELKTTLNKNVKDTIAEAVALDKAGHQHAGRVGKAAQAELAR